MPRVTKPLNVRFSTKYQIDPQTGCWLWTAASSQGRPSIGTTGRVTALAYRVSYEMHVGPVPAGMCVCHQCDTPMCVNPAHLFVGSQADNLADMSSKGRGHGPCANRATAGYRTKITEDDVRAIRASSLSGRVEAERYGVSQPMIAAIKRGAAWRHVV